MKQNHKRHITNTNKKVIIVKCKSKKVLEENNKCSEKKQKIGKQQ